MKGCLKLSPTPTTPGFDLQAEAHCHHTPTTASTTDVANTAPSQTHRKCVAFCAEGSETVYPADEWDRTPAEPARKLSYQ